MPPTSQTGDDALERVHIASLFVESIMYGWLLISFVFAMRYMILDESGIKMKRRVHWHLVVVALLLFSLATVDVCLGLVRVLRLDVHFPPTGVDTMLVIGVFIVIVIVDAVLVYRCWVVYLHSWKVIAVPAALWFGTTATVIFYVYNTVALHVGTPVDTARLEHALEAILSLTIVQNIVSTGLIAGRIWRIDRESAKFRTRRTQKSHLQTVTRIVIESGLLCTLSALCSFISFWTDKNAGYIASDAEIQLVSIAYNLIIIRTAYQTSDEYAFPSPSSGSGPTLQLSIVRAPNGSSGDFEAAPRDVMSSFNDLEDNLTTKKQSTYI
ncbi:hypothetical protein CPB85DRAFT_215648 [Mucidula mucida]|nr:hypothetical protein CPB85DRAFT_215648 [Mucidula mucida]